MDCFGGYTRWAVFYLIIFGYLPCCSCSSHPQAACTDAHTHRTTAHKMKGASRSLRIFQSLTPYATIYRFHPHVP